MSRLIGYLRSVSDEEYRKLTYKLTPNTEYEKIIGVRIPVLRKIAKSIIKQNWQEFLSSPDDGIFELIMLKGIVIATADTDTEKRLEYTERFLPLINNWNVCDIFCASFKPTPSEKEKYLEYVYGYFFDDREFYVRFAVVLSMTLCRDKAETERMMSILVQIKNDAYYVRMAIAWAVSVYFVRTKDVVYPYLSEMRFSRSVQNKSIQKICESLRVSKEVKADIKRYKIPSVKSEVSVSGNI